MTDETERLRAELAAANERILALQAQMGELVEKAASIASDGSGSVLWKAYVDSDAQATSASETAAKIRALRTPAMLAAQQAQQGAAELMRERAAAILDDDRPSGAYNETLANRIRALPLPSAASVLAVIEAARAFELIDIEKLCLALDEYMDRHQGLWPAWAALKPKLFALLRALDAEKSNG